jgi:hypothetical protein
LADGAFDQEAIDLMIAAYEAVCKELHLTNSPYAAANEAVARAVLELVSAGERDVQHILHRIVRSLRRPAAAA